ncbi:FtsL-like putative cell division protein [Hoylesella timonensis]
MTKDDKDIDVQPIPTDAYKDADAALDSSVDKNSEEAPTLKEVIKEQAREEEAPLSRNFTLRKILGGDILTTSTVRKQIWIFLLITFFTIIYISNRYSVQQNLIEIDKLQKELKDARYKALSSSSQLTEKSRESNVLDMLKNNQDSVLKIANQPPYIIQVPNK